IGDYLKWTESGDWCWLNTDRPYPPGLPFGESQSSLFPLAELHDPSLKKLKTAFGNPTYIAPWLFWMDMKDHPGHVVWAVQSKKMASVKEYPRAFLDKLEKENPDKLSAKPAYHSACRPEHKAQDDSKSCRHFTVCVFFALRER